MQKRLADWENRAEKEGHESVQELKEKIEELKRTVKALREEILVLKELSNREDKPTDGPGEENMSGLELFRPVCVLF